MSLKNGMAALKMQFSPKIPRTEYSAADMHFELIKQVTGETGDLKDPQVIARARKEFMRKWDYGMMWSVMVSYRQLKEAGAILTDMGHAVYSGTDFNDKVTNPYETTEAVYAVDPAKQYKFFDQAELIRQFEEHYQKNVAANGDDMVNMSGVYVSMFSGLIGIFGWDALLMALGEDEEKFNKVVNSYAIWSEQFFDALAKSNVPVVMVHDDLCWTSGPVTRPQWYRDNIFPHLRRFIKKLKDAGKLVYFTSDGFIEEFYGDFVDMGVDALVMEPCNDIFKFAELYGDRCGFVGGIDCRDLTYSPLPEIKAKMEKLMALGKRYPGFVLAVGNHMAGDVPAERALYYNELYEKLAVR